MSDCKFRARIGWFWYNDEEIFHDSQQDIDRKVARHAEQGITHLITFSCTHFRWSFQPFWPQINECIAKIVKAAHRHGIKVIEHHSSNLGFYPDTAENLAKFTGEMELRNSEPEHWPGLLEYITSPDALPEQWVQISGKTGKPVVTYGGHGRCFNHPGFRAAYLEYLESVYQLGVDGIMTDDVQYFREDSCACPHCRRLFREYCGYELPPPEKWDAWYGDMLDESFISWLRFRFDSVKNFHTLVKEHYENLGLKLLRPNYTSVALCPNLTAYITDDLPALDWIFQECCYSTIIRYTWPLYLLDQQHRRMMEKKRGIPSMMMFYAEREDQLLFTWGLARLCGALYTNTPEGNSKMDERLLREFEKKYEQYLFHASAMPAVGFIDSLANRRFGAAYEASRMKFWMQSCSFKNIPVELFDIQSPETWKKTSVLCVNEVHVLARNEIDGLLQYARAGGTLVVTGDSGCQDEKLKLRTSDEMADLWNFPREPAPSEIFEFPFGKGKIVRTGWSFGYPGTEEEKRKLFLELKKRFSVLAGEEIFPLRKDIPELWLQRSYGRSSLKSMPNCTLYYDGAESREEVAAFLTRLAGEKIPFQAENLPEGVLAVPLLAAGKKAFTIQLLNAAGTFKRGKEESMSHDDIIPFPNLNGPDAIFSVRLPEKLSGPDPLKAIFTSPGIPEQCLQTQKSGTKFRIEFPLHLLQTCGMILVEVQQ